MRRAARMLLLVAAPVAVAALTPHPVLATDCQEVTDCLANSARGSIAALAGVGLLVGLFVAPEVFGPILFAKGLLEAITGRDLLTGEKLDWLQRALGVIPVGGEYGQEARAAEDATSEARAVGLGRSEPTELTAEQAEQVTNDFRAIGGDPSMLRINEGYRTGYVDGDGVIRVRGDVFPHPQGRAPNEVLTSRAALAHELGHAHYDVPETHPDYLPPGNVDDETRASMWAAKNVPGLSLEERVQLIRDAQQRGGVIAPEYDPFIEDTMNKYWSHAFGGSGGE